MADEATEAEWAKSKRIEAERMKAVKAMEAAKPEMANLAYLDPQQSKPRGWSSDRRVVTDKAEKLAMWGVILAPAGVVLVIISDVGSVVGQANKLGMATMMVSGIPGGLGTICLGLAIFFGLIGFVTAVYYRIRRGQKLGVAGWSGAVAILLPMVYWLIRSLLIG